MLIFSLALLGLDPPLAFGGGGPACGGGGPACGGTAAAALADALAAVAVALAALATIAPAFVIFLGVAFAGCRIRTWA